MNGRSVTVIGSLNVDDALRVTRHPRPGETVGALSAATALGGKGANQAVAAARAGADVRFVGAIGTDNASWLLEALHSDGIDASHLLCLEDAPTGRAIVMVDDHGENSIVVVPGANHRITDETVRDACSALTPGDVILLQNEVPPKISRLAARASRKAGANIVWNAAPAPESLEELITEVDLLVVNEHELTAIASLLSLPGGEVQDRVNAVADRLGTNVVCTLGADGAAYRIDGASGRVPAPSVPVVDTTAAGDTFVGYLAAGLGRRAPLTELLRTASLAGALAVTRHGATTSIPHLREITPSRDLDERTVE